MQVRRGVEPALGKDVDQHRQSLGIVEELVLGVDVSAAGDGMTHDNGHHLVLDEGDDRLHQLRFSDLVSVQTTHEILTSMADDFAGQRQVAELVKSARIELEGALILQLADDVVLHQFQGCLGVDEVVVEDGLQRDERVVGLLFEDLVAVPRQRGIKVGGAFLPQLAEAGTPHLFVVRQDLPATLELACDAFRLIDEEHHDVEDRLLEMRGVGRLGKVTAQTDHFVKEHLEALDLHLRARESVKNGTVLLLRFEQLADQDAHHLAIPHHSSPCFQLAGFRAVEKRTHHDRLRRDAAHFADEVGVRAFARTRRTAEQDQLFREAQFLPAVVLLQLLPNMIKNELGVFDLQIRRGGGFGGGGCRG